MGRYGIGMTGASGAAYGRRVVEALLAQGHHVDLVVTMAGAEVIHYETGFARLRDEAARSEFFGAAQAPGRLVWHNNQDLYADIASGSVHMDGVAIVPCSMDTVSAIATGRSEYVLERMCDVALKERYRLVVVPRETPLSIIHLKNLLAVAEAGGTVLPAMPGFYHRPESLEDLVDFLAGKILNALGLPQTLFKPWDGA